MGKHQVFFAGAGGGFSFQMYHDPVLRGTAVHNLLQKGYYYGNFRPLVASLKEQLGSMQRAKQICKLAVLS